MSTKGTATITLAKAGLVSVGTDTGMSHAAAGTQAVAGTTTTVVKAAAAGEKGPASGAVS